MTCLSGTKKPPAGLYTKTVLNRNGRVVRHEVWRGNRKVSSMSPRDGSCGFMRTAQHALDLTTILTALYPAAHGRGGIAL